MRDLHARLLAAHEANDGPALITLYIEASATAGDETAAAFFLTHAYVFALEAGDPRAATLREDLIRRGRL